MMNAALMYGFIDEMEKLAASSKNSTKNHWAKAKKKEAAFLSNVGNYIRQTGGRAARYLGRHAGEVSVNAAETLHKTFTNPLGAMKEGFKYSLPGSGAGGAGKAMAVGGLGIQGVLGAHEAVGLRHAEDPMGRGRGRGERLGNLVGSTAGGFIGAPHGMTGGIIGSEIAGRGLGAVGKGVDKAVAMVRRKPQSAPMPQGQVQR